MSEKMYRFVCDEIGVYEAVEKQCPRDDKRRECKPDGSWLPKVGETFPEAISFWKEKGMEKYFESGLRDWHYSVIGGKPKLLVANIPKQILYEDEYQVICEKDSANIVKEYPFTYEGPRPALPRKEDPRPSFIRHHEYLRDWNAYCAYRGSDETFTLISSIGVKLGLKKLGIHHEILRPNKRSSWPHAHLIEEELVYIINGEADLWINGRIYSASAGDVIFFPPSTNLAHTILNNGDGDVEIMVIGEQDQKDDLIYYPLHHERNEECKKGGYFWKERPEVSMGDEKASPSIERNVEDGVWEFQKNWKDIEEKEVGGPVEESKIFLKTRDLGRALGAKRVALHRQVLPSGYRSSLPHAESLEEEFIYVLKGRPIIWIDGNRYQMSSGDSVAFPSGTGISHTLINESGEDVELLVLGETTKNDNLCFFPINPEQEDSCGIWWDGAPAREIGDDSSLPKTT